jgi:hypothetical protein
MKNCEPLVFAPAFACTQSDKTMREGDDMGCGAAAHHGKKEGSRMLDREGFILKLFTIDGFATRS